MKILVTGGAGYIGSHVVKQLLETTNNKVVVIDNLCGGNFNPIPVLEKIDKNNRLKFYKENLKNFSKIEEIFKKEKFDAIIHFAAYIQVGESVENPIKYYMNNTVNTTNLINLAVKYNVNKFIFSSTAAVYGEPEIVPIKETTPTTPINPYGQSKLFSEKVLIDVANSANSFKYVIFRYFNVAGCDPKIRIGETHEPETHLIPLVVKTALGKRDKIYIYGDDYDTEDGTCIRDYVHVEDLADAHIKALDYLENNESDIFNIGYGYGFSVKEVIDTVKKVSKKKFDVEVTKKRAGDPSVLIADNSKIMKKMNWKPKYNVLETICKHALDWENKNS